MLEWIKATRIAISVFAGILVFVSFKICKVNFGIAWLLSSTVIAIACATMVHNDWRDRFHDIRKGKLLASSKPREFLAFDVMMWSSSLGLTVAVFNFSSKLAVIPLLAIISGLIYSETRKITMVPIFLVSVTSASPTLFVSALTDCKQNAWLLFLAIFTTILGREIIKDLHDVTIDSGYKWTLPLEFGVNTSETMSAVLILVGSAFLMAISIKTVIGVPFVILAICAMKLKHAYIVSKRLADAGMVISLIILLLA